MAYTEPRTWVQGELVTPALMQAQVSENFRAMGLHLIARRTADQPVTSSTVFVNDDTLQAPVTANEVWYFRWNMFFTGSTSGNLKVQFTFPSGSINMASVGVA